MTQVLLYYQMFCSTCSHHSDEKKKKQDCKTVHILSLFKLKVIIVSLITQSKFRCPELVVFRCGKKTNAIEKKETDTIPVCIKSNYFNIFCLNCYLFLKYPSSLHPDSIHTFLLSIT